MALCKRNVAIWVLLLLGYAVLLDLSSVPTGVFVSAAGSGSHKCSHGHHHHDHHDHSREESSAKLPEELAEEEDMKLYGFGFHDHDDHKNEPFGLLQLSGLGLWVHALGCSFLVSMASLICLIILPVIFVHGKPSKAVVDSLALFGAGAMLGDAFLHQLPHAFGGGHSHNHHEDNNHDHGDHNHGNSHSHAHSLADLSVGLSVLAGIVIFLLVEKAVRYVEDNSGGSHNHGHHHHHRQTKVKDDNDCLDEKQPKSPKAKDEQALDGVSLDEAPSDLKKEGSKNESQIRKRRVVSNGEENDKQDSGPSKCSSTEGKSSKEEQAKRPPSSSLVFGYLNLFSDGVHNFTDGMALGSAFLLYGTVGGWSRTLFLLAHELPQEVGDFGILVRSGFSVSEALFFNFLSALVALFGTALALLWGRDPGQSSLIEGFTAGGFIYIAVAGVLAEMNSSGKTTLRSVAAQLTSLTLGMAVALCISLVE